MNAKRLRAVVVLDPSLSRRIVEGERLGSLMVASVAVVTVGCSLYGIAMGLWRHPLQAFSAGIKLPLMFVATAALTAALDVVLCGLLRARIRPAQALSASLLAMGILGSMLGSLSPIAAFVALQVPAPAGAGSVSTAHWLLTGHVLVLGVAGMVAVGRLRGLLDALIPDAAVSRRVLWAWMVTHGIVGAQLSWVLRPFVGDPTLPVRVVRPDAWHGSFFEAVFEMTVALMGPGGPVTVGFVLLGALAWIALHLDPQIERAEVLGEGLALYREGARASFVVPFQDIVDIAVDGGRVRVDWATPGSLERSTIRVPCGSPEDARVLFEQLAWAMRSGGGYRAPPASSAVSPSGRHEARTDRLETR